ncbi:hypothetical protein POP12_152 [Pectobacterium phage POP12]|nr:hypothetical protein POP12_152 [Pectobacterium phage POP12]
MWSVEFYMRYEGSVLHSVNELEKLVEEINQCIKRDENTREYIIFREWKDGVNVNTYEVDSDYYHAKYEDNPVRDILTVEKVLQS